MLPPSDKIMTKFASEVELIGKCTAVICRHIRGANNFVTLHRQVLLNIFRPQKFRSLFSADVASLSFNPFFKLQLHKAYRILLECNIFQQVRFIHLQ